MSDDLLKEAETFIEPYGDRKPIMTGLIRRLSARIREFEAERRGMRTALEQIQEQALDLRNVHLEGYRKEATNYQQLAEIARTALADAPAPPKEGK